MRAVDDELLWRVSEAVYSSAVQVFSDSYLCLKAPSDIKFALCRHFLPPPSMRGRRNLSPLGQVFCDQILSCEHQEGLDHLAELFLPSLLNHKPLSAADWFSLLLESPYQRHIACHSFMDSLIEIAGQDRRLHKTIVTRLLHEMRVDTEEGKQQKKIIHQRLCGQEGDPDLRLLTLLLVAVLQQTPVPVFFLRSSCLVRHKSLVQIPQVLPEKEGGHPSPAPK